MNMQIKVTCESTSDADKLKCWLNGQSIRVLFNTDEDDNDPDAVVFTIKLDNHVASPCVGKWQLFISRLAATQLCHKTV